MNGNGKLKIVFCPVFGLWSHICIFRGEQTKQNYQEKGIKIFTNGVVVYHGLA